MADETSPVHAKSILAMPRLRPGVLREEIKVDQTVKVIGLMRFSVVIADSTKGYWKNTKGRSLDEIIATILDPARLERRLRLAERMPIASLANQTDSDFQLCILISTLLPDRFKARLATLAVEMPFIRIVEIAVRHDFKAVCAGLMSPDAPCISFRLDDDDAVGPNHVADLRAMAKPENEGKILTFANGLYMERRGERLAFQRVEYVNNAFGISFFSTTGQSIFNQGNHASLSEERTVISSRPDAWIRSIHADSDSDTRFRPGKGGWTVSPEDAASRLPDYAGIEFGKVADDLVPFGAGSRAANTIRKTVERLRKVLPGRH